MVELLFNDPWSIVIVIASVMIAILLYYFGKKKESVKLTLHLIEVAEELFGSKTGNKKHLYVVKKIYPLLPKIIKILYTMEQLDLFVKKIFVISKYYLKKSTP